MDEKFQDKIDDFLLNRMNDAERQAFLQEVEQDSEKKEQLEFTKNVKEAIYSREEKLKVMAEFKKEYNESHTTAMLRSTATECANEYPHSNQKAERHLQSKNKVLIWISGVAAILVVGFFSIRPLMNVSSPDYKSGSPSDLMRGDDEIFDVESDSTDNDTLTIDKDSIVTSNE